MRTLSVPDFERELTAALDGALGEVRLASGRVSIPLAATRAEHYVLERCALIGDAAHTVHPLAGQVDFAEFTNCRLVRCSKGRCRPRRLGRLRRHLIRNT